jgi:hypothetical protein
LKSAKKYRSPKTTKLILLDSLLQEAEATLPEPCVSDNIAGTTAGKKKRHNDLLDQKSAGEGTGEGARETSRRSSTQLGTEDRPPEKLSD